MKKSVGDEAAARGRRISDESLATSPIFFASAPAQESARYFFPIFPSVLLVTLGPAVIMMMTQLRNMMN